MKKPIWVVASGIIVALLLLMLGYVIDQLIGKNSLLMEDDFKILIGIISYSISLGYWLGLSITNKSPTESIFFSSLFGTFTIILTILIFLVGKIVLLFPIIFAVLTPLLLIKSEVVEQERFKFLKKTISVFSEKLSLFITLFFFISWYLSQFLDVVSRYIVSLVLSSIILIIYYAFKMHLESEY